MAHSNSSQDAIAFFYLAQSLFHLFLLYFSGDNQSSSPHILFPFLTSFGFHRLSLFLKTWLLSTICLSLCFGFLGSSSHIPSSGTPVGDARTYLQH